MLTYKNLCDTISSGDLMERKYIVRRTVFISVLCVLLAGVITAVWIFNNNQSEPKKTAELENELSQTAFAKVSRYANDNNIPISAYPNEICELLDSHPEAEDFVLSYPLEKDKKHYVDLSEYASSENVPLFMQFDKRWGYIEYGSNVAGLTGCGPVCLSMVAYYFMRTNEVSPDKVIQFAKERGYCTKGSGSSWTLISKGGEKLGLNVKELPLDENVMVSALNAGKKIILVVGKGDFTSSGHYIVLTGYSDGEFTVNDPYSIVNSNKRWTYERLQDQIKNIWALWK